MKKWCKIIEINEHQVLIRKGIELDGKEENHVIGIITIVEGIWANLKLTFKNEKDMNDAFNDKSIEDYAQRSLSTVFKW